jgi:hypothetical protein
MFSLFNPWVIIGAIATFIGVYFYGHHAGYQQRVDEDQAEIIRLNDEARAKEAELNQKIAVANTALRKAKDEIKTKQSNINARIDSGELRLPTSCPVQTDSSAAAGTGDKGSESDRQAIKDIVAITSDGDAAIKDLNACIAQYNSVRETVNKGVK